MYLLLVVRSCNRCETSIYTHWWGFTLIVGVLSLWCNRAYEVAKQSMVLLSEWCNAAKET